MTELIIIHIPASSKLCPVNYSILFTKVEENGLHHISADLTQLFSTVLSRTKSVIAPIYQNEQNLPKLGQPAQNVNFCFSHMHNHHFIH